MKTASPLEAELEPRDGTPPRSWTQLGERYPDVVAAYDALSDACRNAGPLDEPTAALIKLAVSVGSRSTRTVHAHAKKALRAGAAPGAVRHVAVIALPTVGLPATLDALKCIDDSIREELRG